MAVLNSNGFFALTGVGLFGANNKGDTTTAIWQLTIVNVAGWFPCVSIIAGIASVFFAGCLSEGRVTNPDAAVALVIRGALQIAQVGILLAPFDIGFSLVRLVREHMQQIAAQQV